MEIARIELASVTADVISVRVRKDDKGFHYRIVDKYDNESLAEPTEIVATEPLCPLDFGTFVCNAANLADIVSFNEFEDSEATRAFISGTSMFYPQFGMFVSRTISHQVRSAEESDISGRCSRIPQLEGIVLAQMPNPDIGKSEQKIKGWFPSPIILLCERLQFLARYSYPNWNPPTRGVSGSIQF